MRTNVLAAILVVSSLLGFAGKAFLSPVSGAAATAPSVVVHNVDTSHATLPDGDAVVRVHQAGYDAERQGWVAGEQVGENETDGRWRLALPDGVYIVSSRPAVSAVDDLWNHSDADSNAQVPVGASCLPSRQDCVTIVVEDDHVRLWDTARGTDVSEIRFTYRRSAPDPTPPPTTEPPAGEPDEGVGPQFFLDIDVVDVSSGAEIDTAVTFSEYRHGRLTARGHTVGDTDTFFAATTGTHVLYLVALPDGYRFVDRGRGSHLVGTRNHTVRVRVERLPEETQPEDTQPEDTQPEETLPEVALPEVALPAPTPGPTSPQPSPTPPPAGDGSGADATDPEPADTPTDTAGEAGAPEPTQPPAEDPAPPTTEAPTAAGCDETADPELAALLWSADGRIRFFDRSGSYHELTMEAVAESAPITVCLAAYHRITELYPEIDPLWIDVGWE